MLTRMTRRIAALIAAGLLLAGCGGSSTATTSSAPSSGSWSTINLSRDFGTGANAVDVSCTAGSFCMVLGANAAYTNWKTVTYRNGQVGTASQLTAGPGALLACASSRYCVSYTPGENLQTYSVWNGSRWSAHATHFRGEPSGTGLTCPSSQLCLAIGNNGSEGAATLLYLTPHGLAEKSFANRGQTLTSLTCASAKLCFLIGDAGDVWSFTGLTHPWTGPEQLTVPDRQGTPDPVNEIACASGPYCVGVGTGGGVVTDTGTGFHTLTGVRVQGGTGLESFAGSCGSASFCLVQTAHGYAVLDGDRLNPIATPPATPSGAFSCTADRLCMDDLATSSAKVLLYRGA